MIKTNVMRILDKNKIEYKVHDYSSYGFTNGEEIAKFLNQDPKNVFKTLITRGKSKEYYVFMIPVDKELDLKKCALSVNEKSIEMIHQKELFPLTGYIHGGCSPLGMKKEFKTVIDESILNIDIIYFSAGKVGYQIEMNKDLLSNALNYELYNLIKLNN